MVAQGAPGEEFFAAVVGEIGTLFGVDAVGLGAYHDGESLARLAMWAAHEQHHPSFPDLMLVEPGSLAWKVALNSARRARMTGLRLTTRPHGSHPDRSARARRWPHPIDLGGEVWGMIAVHSNTQALPPDTEARLARFSELVAIALANTEARRAVRTLADEQAALRRVATLIAQQTLFLFRCFDSSYCCRQNHSGDGDRVDAEKTNSITRSATYKEMTLPVGMREEVAKSVSTKKSTWKTPMPKKAGRSACRLCGRRDRRDSHRNENACRAWLKRESEWREVSTKPSRMPMARATAGVRVRDGRNSGAGGIAPKEKAMKTRLKKIDVDAGRRKR